MEWKIIDMDWQGREWQRDGNAVHRFEESSNGGDWMGQDSRRDGGEALSYDSMGNGVDKMRSERK